MEKALRILDDAVKALESEVRIWTKQGDLDIVEKCKKEIKECNEAIEKLRGGECSNDNSGLNIPVVNASNYDRIRHRLIGKACSLAIGEHNTRYEVATALIDTMIEEGII